MTKDHLISIETESGTYVINLCKVLYAEVNLLGRMPHEPPKYGMFVYFDKGERMIIAEQSPEKANKALLKLLGEK